AGEPERIVAVTGTNGKTSTVNFTRQIWEKLGERAASLGTLGVIGEGLSGYSGMTTPDPVELHKTLQDLKQKGFDYLAMEASSIGIEQHRLNGITIGAAGYTNLTHDHLDYHGTMEAYKSMKMRLFSKLLKEDGVAVVNADTPEFAEIKTICEKRGITFWGYGHKGDALKLVVREAIPTGQNLTLDVLGAPYEVFLPLVGEFQTMNVLCALGLVLAEGKFEVHKVIETLSTLSPIPGRLQQVSNSSVYVDYAHTPDALENVLNALRPHTAGRLICLFGCGGDRDKTKRPKMGEISSRLADVTIVTDDNPRSEDLATIRSEILGGASQSAINIDGRRTAIRKAVAMMQNGDVLVLAGKGHEHGQIFATHTEHFDDVEEASNALKEAAQAS
ncbi:MAG TPA: UDP-N-acetylmuramoyl-L-alanyl-D-glutamate--2,6-diaminopimelate ligase, partial [Alphaproteobacteria bacterium]|nr:UDP-N-acetylmuramoyl-L-alanyl-D-glutamate--2,6-diaminopimelate ligase [Alphaproteobacteria bacterium]